MGTNIADVLIIGGGPVGIYGLYLTGLHHLKTVMIERLSRLGGQLEHLYPEKPIYDVGGFPLVTGHELVVRLLEQANQYPHDVYTNTVATGVIRHGDLWQIETTQGTFTAKSVIITAGIGEFLPRRFNDPAIDRFEGRGLYYTVEHLEDFRGHRVLIIGGGDSAADWAMAVAPRAERIWMIHRRDGFQCHADSLAKLKNLSNVSLLTHHELLAVDGSYAVDGAQIRHNQSQRVTRLDVDRIIVAIGLIPGTDIFRDWGIELNGHELAVNSAMLTNLPGILAAGDIVSYPGKVKLISVGFGEVATAVESARRYLPTVSVRDNAVSNLLG